MEELSSTLGKATCIAMGLQIFAKYGDHDVCAVHDELFAGAQVEGEEADLLESLGWRWQADDDCWAMFTQKGYKMNWNCLWCIIPIVILSLVTAYAMCKVAGDDDTRNGRQEWQQ